MSYTFYAFSFVSANEVNVLQDRKTIRKRFFSSYLMKIYYSKFDKDQTFIFVCRRSFLSDIKHFMINM